LLSENHECAVKASEKTVSCLEKKRGVIERFLSGQLTKCFSQILWNTEARNCQKYPEARVLLFGSVIQVLAQYRLWADFDTDTAKPMIFEKPRKPPKMYSSLAPDYPRLIIRASVMVKGACNLRLCGAQGRMRASLCADSLSKYRRTIYKRHLVVMFANGGTRTQKYYPFQQIRVSF
jgi:hypothetical protein